MRQHDTEFVEQPTKLVDPHDAVPDQLLTYGMHRHAWPGNVHELKNMTRRAAIPAFDGAPGQRDSLAACEEIAASLTASQMRSIAQ